MTLLAVIQTACNEIGIDPPSSVIGNANSQIKQLLALANREGNNLSSRNYNGWNILTREATFTTVATESQGSVETIAPGYRYIINQTIWNRTQRRPVYGPISPQNWQMLQSSPVTGPYDQFRIRGGNILFDPIPSAGETCAFEYVTSNWCESSGGTGQDAWADDTDVGRLDEDLMTLGIIWRWQAAKKLQYAENYAEYERRVTDAISRDGTKPIGRLGGGVAEFAPGIFVPQTGYGS